MTPFTYRIAVFFLCMVVPVLSFAERPNVILIMTDDQGYGDFGATGNVGRLFAKLDTLGITDNTLVVFLVDNGPNTARYVGPFRGRDSVAAVVAVARAVEAGHGAR